MESNQKPLSNEQITALCRRGFGNSFQIRSIEPLSGGTFNTTAIIIFTDGLKVVLRVAPLHTADTYWEEAFLMRREHAMLPFFAPVAALMPKTLLIDFTHELIDRDYMFQSFIEGERWDDIATELTDEENQFLWKKFGEITKQIHEVHGQAFGLPLPDLQFPAWSQFIIERLDRTQKTAQNRQLELPYLPFIREFIGLHPQQLDEVHTPHLLHGDLWLFNILIQRNKDEPAIVGILDADRSWWGDPLADWTMFILRHAEKEEGHTHFWKAYGPLEDTQSLRFRTAVYDAMHAATAYLWAAQHRDEGTIERATGTLSDVAAALPDLV